MEQNCNCQGKKRKWRDIKVTRGFQQQIKAGFYQLASETISELKDRSVKIMHSEDRKVRKSECKQGLRGCGPQSSVSSFNGGEEESKEGQLNLSYIW